MIFSVARTLFFVGALVTVVVPVGAQCDPSHAVVAVASVLSTLAVVTIVLIGVYFFLNRRRRGIKLSKNVYEIKKRADGHNNYGFTGNENVVSVEGITTPRQKGRAHFPEQVSPEDNDSETWPSPPRSARLYRKGSLGSLDETAKFVEQEIISVTLESQDIIGLGFNICGNYGDGIRVSEVHNRGPAKESGNIDIGDKILSVQVSYQNIVYEDALTILSYASPYPVKIIIEKAVKTGSNDFEDGKQKGNSTHRITHPLFRSRSLNTLKFVNPRNNATHPKRAVSDLKLESVKYFLNWRSKNSKKGNNSQENRSSFAKRVLAQHENSAEESKGKTVIAQHESDIHINTSIYENKKPGYMKLRSTLQETVAEVTPVSHINTEKEFHQQISHPDKPERKTKRDGDLQEHFENQTTTPTRRPFVYPISAVTDDEIDVDEMFIVPDILSYVEDEESPGNTSQLARNTEDITMHPNQELQTSTVVNLSDDFRGVKSLFPTLSSDILADVHKPSDNISNMPEALINPSVTHRDIATVVDTAAAAAGTHNLSAELAAECQDDSVDEFDLNQTDQNSNSNFISKEISLADSPNGELTDQEHSLRNNHDFVFDGKDHMTPGNPFLADIAKHALQTEVTPNADKCSNNTSYPTIFPTSASFLNNNTTSSHGSNSSRASPENTDESEISDTLEWSGKRLVRSASFSNIFVDD